MRNKWTKKTNRLVTYWINLKRLGSIKINRDTIRIKGIVWKETIKNRILNSRFVKLIRKQD